MVSLLMMAMIMLMTETFIIPNTATHIFRRGHEDPVNALDVVDNVLFSGCRGGHVRIWSTVTNDCLRVYSGHTGAVSGAAF